ncbi:hypothetical protein AB0M42_26790 [Streptomyces sp. NPDC051784]|uniref:hypothetical protein n=1 Tax=Streptomyces sp. NPDC051784 TaxID=3155805 RepID=UPI003430CDCD
MEPEESTDSYWLLYEIRSRRGELTAAAQGPGGRELSRNAMASTVIHWPPSSVRERFAQLTGKLHMRAKAAHAENAHLITLRQSLLRDFLEGAPHDAGVQDALQRHHDM